MYARLQSLPVSNDPLRLNPLLNRAQLAEQFRLRGRIQIGDVLTAAPADRVHHCLQNETRYVLCSNIGGTVRALQDLTASERQACTIAAWQEVGIKGFQFLYRDSPDLARRRALRGFRSITSQKFSLFSMVPSFLASRAISPALAR